MLSPQLRTTRLGHTFGRNVLLEFRSLQRARRTQRFRAGSVQSLLWEQGIASGGGAGRTRNFPIDRRSHRLVTTEQWLLSASGVRAQTCAAPRLFVNAFRRLCIFADSAPKPQRLLSPGIRPDPDSESSGG